MLVYFINILGLVFATLSSSTAVLVSSFCKYAGFLVKGVRRNIQPVRFVVNDRGLFTAGWFGVREKYCSSL